VSELTLRVLFGVVAAPIAIAIVLIGGAPLAALLAIASAIAAWEFFRIAKSAGHEPMSDIGCALAGLVPLAVHAHQLGLFRPRVEYFAAVLVVLIGAALWLRGASGKPIAAVATTVLGVLYTGGLLSFGYAMRYHDYAVGGVPVGSFQIAAGGVLLGLPVLATWATDIGAFQVGRMVGGKKLMPSVSPGKTVSGGIGGLIGSVLLTWLYVRFALRPAAQLAMSPLGILVFGVVISVVGQVGDLVESMFKREAGVKDSSKIIPGHGGVLDRLDSLFFVLPVAYLLFGWLLIPAPR
jgi:phosphatidate cytidylyltransferase